jgi:hypothetical protein
MTPMIMIKDIDFAFSKDLVVSSIYFPHKDIHKYAWTSPYGITQSDRSPVDIEE